MRFPRIQVTMTHNQRLRITLMQILQQTSQRTLLRLGSGVAGSLAVSSKSSHVCHPDRMPVMVLAMRPHHLLRSTCLNGAVRRNHVVVAAALPTQPTMIAVDVRHPKGTARPVGGAMHDNQSNLPHRISFINPQTLNRIQADESFLYIICLTSAEKLLNPQMPNRIQTDESFLYIICLTSADKN